MKRNILIASIIIIGLMTGCASRDPNYGQARTTKRVNDKPNETSSNMSWLGTVAGILTN